MNRRDLQRQNMADAKSRVGSVDTNRKPGFTELIETKEASMTVTEDRNRDNPLNWLEEHKESEELLSILQAPLYLVDRDRQIVLWNKGAERITGYAAEEVRGRRCADGILQHTDCQGAQLCHGDCPLSESMKDGETRVGEVFLLHRDGYRLPVKVWVSPLRNAEGETIGGIESFEDISQQVAALEAKLAAMREAERLREMAFLDPLTRIANRRALENRMRELFDTHRADGQEFGVLVVDLDHFKRVNDEHGHDAGDAVLKIVAKTLSSRLTSPAMIGRWGGEEFVAVVPNTSPDQLRATAESCRGLVAASPTRWRDQEIAVTASFGAAVANGEPNWRALFRLADQNLYRAKSEGRNRVVCE
jgi:diguanylate cyclase (GGDEF)-like protein/PAS domain S-box-containing protein